MKNRKQIIGILLILIIVSFSAYLISKRNLCVTGYVLNGDKLQISINNNDYTIRKNSSSNKSLPSFIYEDIKFRSIKNVDQIHVICDSSEIILIDTIILLNKNNTNPRVFFENPVENKYERKVFLLNDSGLITY
ncbi:MAG: hypothetical protein NTZ19_07525 [Bacteroidetes bacterium]|nr:hypothetical protein [Bacteroidota bacterium]